MNTYKIRLAGAAPTAPNELRAIDPRVAYLAIIEGICAVESAAHLYGTIARTLLDENPRPMTARKIETLHDGVMCALESLQDTTDPEDTRFLPSIALRIVGHDGRTEPLSSSMEFKIQLDPGLFVDAYIGFSTCVFVMTAEGDTFHKAINFAARAAETLRTARMFRETQRIEISFYDPRISEATN